MIEERVNIFKEKIYKNLDNIIDSFIEDHSSSVCSFCGSSENITREHVLPRWTFWETPERTFVTTANKLPQKYNSSTVPACFECNSYLLGAFEDYIKELLNNRSLPEDFFSETEIKSIIFWFELIEYKFQLFDLRRSFLKHKDHNFIKYLKNIPIAMMHQNLSGDPEEVFSNLKSALQRCSEEISDSKLNSLVIFKTKNESFHFIHSIENFIFLELPQCGKAFFYFFNKEFKEDRDAYLECMEVIKENY